MKRLRIVVMEIPDDVEDSGDNSGIATWLECFKDPDGGESFSNVVVYTSLSGLVTDVEAGKIYNDSAGLLLDMGRLKEGT